MEAIVSIVSFIVLIIIFGLIDDFKSKCWRDAREAYEWERKNER